MSNGKIIDFLCMPIKIDAPKREGYEIREGKILTGQKYRQKYKDVDMSNISIRFYEIIYEDILAKNGINKMLASISRSHSLTGAFHGWLLFGMFLIRLFGFKPNFFASSISSMFRRHFFLQSAHNWSLYAIFITSPL